MRYQKYIGIGGTIPGRPFFVTVRAIIFEYYNGKKREINLHRFSRKQIKTMMDDIRIIGEQNYGMSIEINQMLFCQRERKLERDRREKVKWPKGKRKND